MPGPKEIGIDMTSKSKNIIECTISRCRCLVVDRLYYAKAFQLKMPRCSHIFHTNHRSKTNENDQTLDVCRKQNVCRFDGEHDDDHLPSSHTQQILHLTRAHWIPTSVFYSVVQRSIGCVCVCVSVCIWRAMWKRAAAAQRCSLFYVNTRKPFCVVCPLACTHTFIHISTSHKREDGAENVANSRHIAGCTVCCTTQFQLAARSYHRCVVRMKGDPLRQSLVSYVGSLHSVES